MVFTRIKWSYWLGIGILCSASALLLASGGHAAESSENRVVLAPEVRRVLQAQRSLPAESVLALQDLRLVAAVQLAYFSSQGGYLPPEQLQEMGRLSRGWPHANPNSYKVSCTIDREGLSFVCFADALAPKLYYFMIDTSQAVRYARQGRPNAASPMFGTTEESLP